MRALAALGLTIGVLGSLGSQVAAARSSGAPPSAPKFPTGGLIVFAGNCGRCPVGEGLYTIRPDRRNVRFLMNGIGTAHPRWSPNGRWIATAKSSEIVLVAANNSGALRTITRPPDLNAGGSDSEPSWARDGKHLVFVRVSADSSAPTAIWSVGANGRGARVLLSSMLSGGSGNVVYPELSPDGRRLAYSDSVGMWVANADGSDRRRVGSPDSQGVEPRWSPDGRRIAYVDTVEGGLRVLDLGTGYVHTVPGNGVGAYAWSPDGHWLAVARYVDYSCTTDPDGCTNANLWIVNASDDRQRRILRVGIDDGSEIDGLDWRQ